MPVCACSDPGCPAHPGLSRCLAQATTIVHRVDMHDPDGLPLCGWCTDDALGSGLFIEED